ncbi:hypothetical protein ACQBAT_08330 [Ornithinimicrobium sp. Y1847]|uniref:hypothetical protein n=1 Tax=Ornithinimicrobium sp. Y1847 TaxID=3405419 RepID=UPI003B671CEC
MPVLGGGEGGSWERLRSRCLACGAEELLDDGAVRVRSRVGEEVVWVGATTTADFHFGFAGEREELPLHTRRCRECRFVQFYAEADD